MEKEFPEAKDARSTFQDVRIKRYINFDIPSVEYQEVKFGALNENFLINIKHVRYKCGRKALNKNIKIAVNLNTLLYSLLAMKKDFLNLSKTKKVSTGLARVFTNADNDLQSEIAGGLGFIKEKEFYYLCLDIKNEGTYTFALDNVFDIDIKYNRLPSKAIQDYNFMFAKLYFEKLFDNIKRHLELFDGFYPYADEKIEAADVAIITNPDVVGSPEENGI